jgi:hypothetical protein
VHKPEPTGAAVRQIEKFKIRVLTAKGRFRDWLQGNPRTRKRPNLFCEVMRTVQGQVSTTAEAEILGRLDRLEAMLLQALDRRHLDPDIYPWRTVAGKLGIVGKAPDQAARRRVIRARDGGEALRVTRNGVLRVDFDRWISNQAAQHPSKAEIVRTALRGARR